MGLFQKNICPNCGEEYSAFKTSCPNCGARRQNSSGRTPASTDSLRDGTQENARAQADSRWQLIFGLCLVAAVIIAVIVLITTTLKGDYGNEIKDMPASTPPAQVEETMTPPPSTPPPAPIVEELKITFLGEDKTEFSMHPGNKLQLDASIYPVEIEGPVEWSSTDEEVLTISSEGQVTAVGSGTASIICKCYEKTAECVVMVW